MKLFLLVIFWGLWFLNFCSRTALSPLLPIVENELAITHALAGGLFFYLAMGFTLSVFASGRISEYIGYKRAILLSYLTLALALFCFRYADTYQKFAAISFLVGIGSGLYFPNAVPIITSIFSRENWGKAISFHETAPPTSFLATPILVALTLQFFHWKSYFLLVGGACLFFSMLFWIFAPNPVPKQKKPMTYRTILRRKDFWLMVIPWTVSGIATTGIYNIIPLFLVTEKEMELALANTVFGLTRIGGLLAVILSGLVLDRYGARRIIFVILFTSGLSTIGLALAQWYWLLVGMLIVQATVSIAFFPAAVMMISKITSLEERTTFMGLIMSIGNTFGVGISPVILGAVADRWNFSVGIFAVGVLALASCFVIRSIEES